MTTALDLVKLHAEFVAPKIISLARQTVGTGLPVLRPMWWIAPDEPAAYKIDDQYLIGEFARPINRSCPLITPPAYPTF
mgnify:CR=1 FL=1